MKGGNNNIAYIDGANLYNGIADFGWVLDYVRFRVWLTEKYGVKNAYIFIGLIPKFKELYNYLQKSGFTLVFKGVIYNEDGKPKGNCDADLVLQVAKDIYEEKCEKAIIVSSDGDYAGLIKFLISKNKIEAVLSPYETNKCSVLIKRTGVKISYLVDQRTILEAQKEKAPDGDETS